MIDSVRKNPKTAKWEFDYKDLQNMINANEILQKTLKLRKRSEELAEQIASPSVIADNKKWRMLAKEHSNLQEIVSASEKLERSIKDKEQCEKDKSLEKDHEMKQLFEEECVKLENEIQELCEEIKILLLPKDENDDGNIIMEIRAAAGGEESALFATELLRMYTYYAEQHHWKIEMSDVNETELGGIKEATFIIKGKGAYSRLKYESGAHRVQRVPETESSGRVHTSAATVAVLPEVDDVEVDLNPNDVRVDVYRASGNGGQCVNTTDSAVRLTHEPTGLVVTCQDEKSQIKNKEKAFKVLRSRLYDLKMQEQNDEISQQRKSQVGSGDRSERIRTYNFPQGRVSDHRTGVTLYKLDNFLDGDMDEIIDGLITSDQAEKMKNF